MQGVSALDAGAGLSFQLDQAFFEAIDESNMLYTDFENLASELSTWLWIINIFLKNCG